MTASRRFRGAAAVAVALVVALAPGVAAHAAPMPDYPSWDEVEAAKADEAASAAAVAQIEAALAVLETEAAELGKVALLRAEESDLAQQELEAATERVENLETRSAEARDQADESARRAAQILTQLSRTGGGDPTLALLFGSAEDTDEVLSMLASMSRLSETSRALLEQAVFDRNSADSLAAEAELAEEKRGELAEVAAEALAEAEAAVEEAQARVEETRADSERMYAQLASLKNTSADLEQAYQEGLAWEREQAADPTPPVPPADDPDPPAEEPAPPASDKVSGAISYARAQLGEPYVWGGAGPSGWDCSGLTMMAYSSVGVSIGGHGSTSQYNYLKSAGKLVNIADLQAGDLLFYSDGGSTTGTKYHVALYVGNGKMIEAPYPGQVVREVSIRYGDLVPYAGRPTG
ncbi:C40 family peptidase [uncultured Schumannella sp.]|uniref:C40 family peptidase n=1 Tax=uncultured Schumannella sp. TaxID=1195956 RepID=UPI0025F12AB2|nr:C40 family peptidase [uncultured Schumannella sp.]